VLHFLAVPHIYCI